MMKYLVAYDIGDDRVRAKVSRLLMKYGYRIQLSVFYLPKVSISEVESLVKAIREMVDPRKDRVFFYPVESVEEFLGYPLEPWEVLVV